MGHRFIETSNCEYGLIEYAGMFVMRGNGRFSHELWYTKHDKPDRWNLWRVSPKDNTRSDRDKGTPQWTGEPHQVWWWGSYLPQCDRYRYSSDP